MMNKQDMQLQVLQMLYNDTTKLNNMPQRWRIEDKDKDTSTFIRRTCGRGTIDQGAVEHFAWSSPDDYDYTERMYDAWGVLYECPKFQQLERDAKALVDKYQKEYPTSDVSIEVDGVKDVFYLNVFFTLSDEDYEASVKKLTKKKSTPKKEKSLLSDKGKDIISWLQEQAIQPYTAREIAEGLFCSSRSIPGAMTKLSNDGFINIQKIGAGSPNKYQLTTLGKGLDLTSC